MKVVQAEAVQTFRLGLFEGMTGCNMTSKKEEASQERQQRSLSCCCFSPALEFWKPFEPEYHSAGSFKRNAADIACCSIRISYDDLIPTVSTLFSHSSLAIREIWRTARSLW